MGDRDHHPVPPESRAGNDLRFRNDRPPPRIPLLHRVARAAIDFRRKIMERIISADSHTIEPSDLWLGALGRKYGDETPRVVEGYQGQPGLFFFTGKQYAR